MHSTDNGTVPMDLITIEPENFIENLKCTICNNYLSLFPIHTSPNNHNTCGRCPTPEQAFYRNKIYEIACQEIRFPCCNVSEGCCEKNLPKDVASHEAQCIYRKAKCLTHNFTGCDVKISYQNLLIHCRREHSDIILKNGQFEIMTSKSQQSYNLLEQNDQLFVVQRKFRMEDRGFQISVMSCDDQKLSYKVRLMSGNIEVVVRSNTTEGLLEIFLDQFMTQRDRITKITGKIFVMKKTNAVEGSKDSSKRMENGPFPIIPLPSTSENNRGNYQQMKMTSMQKIKKRSPFYFPVPGFDK